MTITAVALSCQGVFFEKGGVDVNALAMEQFVTGQSDDPAQEIQRLEE